MKLVEVVLDLMMINALYVHLLLIEVQKYHKPLHALICVAVAITITKYIQFAFVKNNSFFKKKNR